MPHNAHNSPVAPKVLLFFVDSALCHEAPEPISHNKPPLPHPSTVLTCRNLRPDIAHLRPPLPTSSQQQC
ncbi:hypothetical protein BGW80DRAFT_1354366 [Lactifluus volemus]|nr:hypothetical protein BGW80DRAFT_1354366 [Lactifluus volemus]